MKTFCDQCYKVCEQKYIADELAKKKNQSLGWARWAQKKRPKTFKKWEKALTKLNRLESRLYLDWKKAAEVGK